MYKIIYDSYNLFIIHPNSLELWRAFPQVLVIDARYKTNSYHMPLLEIVGVTSTNKTFSIAFVFMHEEKVPNYIWALECLKSNIYDNFYPSAIVTDRELALINACKKVFPTAKRLLCRWHINHNVINHCRPMIQNSQEWSSFYQSWSSLLESPNEEVYKYHLAKLQEKLLNYPGVWNYVNGVWLTPYKEMFVDQYLNFGNHTTNRVESQHAKLKKYIESPRADLQNFLSHIHQVIQSQDTSIKASFEMSRNIRKHLFKDDQFNILRGFVSFNALDMIFNENKRIFAEQCGCKLRTSHGLPCAHELALYRCQHVPIPLDAIDIFWKKLDFSPCVSAHDGDIQCDDEVQMFTENFNKQSGSGKKSMLQKLKNMIKPQKTLFHEPAVHITSRGRPSLKKSSSKKSNIEDSRRYSTSNAPTFINSEDFGRQESARHSSYFQRQPTPRNRYFDQIPSLFHPYIMHIQDVLGDGNCGFRAISTCLGGDEDAWDNIRKELMDELCEHYYYYNNVITNEGPRIYDALNFFQKGVFAPVPYWIAMPEMAILAASKYNVILHVLSMRGSVTYLPFRTPPPPSQHVSIAIVHVDNNHYIKVVLNGEYPMPTLIHHWTRHRLEEASTWIDSYRRRFDMYEEYIDRVHTSDYMDVDE
ncbi:hypothetical protein OSB04_028780 [Centaurea solstitialis]|uniref:SWIM-type domain-containing protein n=1 Tax=Centaurea solstitialis TaxID=347529 RepID=A0AA38SHY7_9ASTR|nr:hypothetical protein OSB04_028780 [Centaurea solstitialis]